MNNLYLRRLDENVEEQPLIIIFHRGCVGSCVCEQRGGHRSTDTMERTCTECSNKGDEDWKQAIVQAVDQSSSGRKKYNVGLRTMDKDSARKRSIIKITNQDQLCCARTIVTMRAWCHRNDPNTWDHMPWNTWLMELYQDCRRVENQACMGPRS